MNKKTQMILISVVVIAFVGLALFLYPSLPANIPMQWGLSGKVNYSLPKLPVVVAMVAIDVGFGVYSTFMHRAEKKIPRKDFLAALLFPIIFSLLLLIPQFHF
jgi:hypothetical protein